MKPKLIMSDSVCGTCNANLTGAQYILLNDFTCREIRLHNADQFNRMIALGSIQRYAI